MCKFIAVAVSSAGKEKSYAKLPAVFAQLHVLMAAHSCRSRQVSLHVDMALLRLINNAGAAGGFRTAAWADGSALTRLHAAAAGRGDSPQRHFV